MTTVGYGDKTPKSVVGRLFAVVWILSGITICALMTAALTTAISEVASQQKPSVYHGNIGILKNHVFEKTILMKGNADYIPLVNVKQMIDYLNSGVIDGALIDTYTAKHTGNKENLLKNELTLDNVIQDTDQSYLGITIYDSDLYYLLAEYIEFNRDSILEHISKNMKKLIEIQDVIVESNLIFTKNSGLLEPLVIVGVTILIVSILTGIIYESYQYHKRHSIKVTPFQITCKSIAKEQNNFYLELEDLLIRYQKLWKGSLKIFSLNGMFRVNESSLKPEILLDLTANKSKVLSDKNNSNIFQNGTKKENSATQNGDSKEKKSKKIVKKVKKKESCNDYPPISKKTVFEKDKKPLSPIKKRKLPKYPQSDEE